MLGVFIMHKVIGLLFFGLSCVEGLAIDDQKKSLVQELHQNKKSFQGEDPELMEFDAQREIDFLLLLHTERAGAIPRALLTEDQIETMEQFAIGLAKEITTNVNQARSLNSKLNILLRSRFKAKNVMSSIVMNYDRNAAAEGHLMRVRSGAAKLECDRCKKQ